MQSQLRGADADDEVSLFDLWRIVRNGWVTVAMITFASGAIVAVVSLLMTPLFDARTVIMEVDPADQGGAGAQALLGQFGGLAELAGVNLENLGRSKSNGRTLIQSRTFVEEFIERNDLLPLIFPDDWDATTKSWKPGLDHPRTVWEGADEFKKRAFRLSIDQETGLYSLTVRWTDRETAARWANELVGLANEIARQKDIAEAERSMAYLNKQIDQTNVVELQRVLYELLENELRTLLLANARDDYAFRVVDRAVPPVYRARPRRTLMTALALAAGAFFGIAFVLARGVVRVQNERRGESGRP
jgi:uncharacterized protein involved in exopolysaccharide biosynthesis